MMNTLPPRAACAPLSAARGGRALPSISPRLHHAAGGHRPTLMSGRITSSVITLRRRDSTSAYWRCVAPCATDARRQTNRRIPLPKPASVGRRALKKQAF